MLSLRQIQIQAANYSNNENDDCNFSLSVQVGNEWISPRKFFKSMEAAEYHARKTYCTHFHVLNRESGSVVYKNY